MRLNPTLNAATMLSAAVATLALAGCGGPSASNVPGASVTPTDPTAEAAQAQAEADRAALQAREDELAKREAALALAAREQELARREAELAAKERAPKKVAATPKPVPAKAVAVPASKPTVVAKPAPVPVQPILIPAGTELSIGLSSAVSTKSASIGDPVDARLASDLVVDGRRAILAGAPIRGRVTEVVSGSKRIGGTPTLAMNFDGIELEDGKTVAISGQLVQQGKSDTGRDTAKIVGGTAAGAIIGHQIDDDKGKVIGGILGGAAGVIAARKTGSEIDVPAGTVMAFVVDRPFQVMPD
jgi:Glycine zipper 2TM domain